MANETFDAQELLTKLRGGSLNNPGSNSSVQYSQKSEPSVVRVVMETAYQVVLFLSKLISQCK